MSAATAKGAAMADLKGTWIVTVLPTAPPGPKGVLPPPSFTSLQAYTGDGSVFEDGAPTGRTTAYGSWKNVGGQKFAATTWFISLNPDNQLETERIDRSIELDGDKFEFQAVVRIFDVNNVMIRQGGAMGTGTRVGVIPQAELSALLADVVVHNGGG